MKNNFGIQAVKRLLENLLSVKVWIGISIFTLSYYYFMLSLNDLNHVLSKYVLGSLDEQEAQIIIVYMNNIKELVIAIFKLLGSAGIGLAGIREVFKTAKLGKNGKDKDIPV